MAKLIKTKSKIFLKCLENGVSDLKKSGEISDKTAIGCVRTTKKITRSADPSRGIDGKFISKVSKSCDPALNAHTFSDIRGDDEVGGVLPTATSPLNFKFRDEICGVHSGLTDSIEISNYLLDTVEALTSCMITSFNYAIAGQLVLSYPGVQSLLGVKIVTKIVELNGLGVISTEDKDEAFATLGDLLNHVAEASSFPFHIVE